MTKPPSIAMSDKFQLAALTDRLIYGSETTFDPRDARELDRLLPHLPRWQRLLDLIPLQLKAGVQSSGSSHKGFAAGVGSVTLRDGSETYEFDSHGRRVIRAGQWKLSRVGGDIQIEQMMSGELDEARSARLEFSDGEPMALLLLVQTMLEIGPICVGYGTFKPWKEPEAGGIE
jgi:hypothetical protein